jgi:hypothetical protein
MQLREEVGVAGVVGGRVDDGNSGIAQGLFYFVLELVDAVDANLFCAKGIWCTAGCRSRPVARLMRGRTSGPPESAS